LASEDTLNISIHYFVLVIFFNLMVVKIGDYGLLGCQKESQYGQGDNDLKQTHHGLIKVLCWHLPGESKETHKKPQPV
jgi:hypothetical protein